MQRFGLPLAAAVALGLGGAVPPSEVGAQEQYVERGKASWYGGSFHGRKTASGEIFDAHQLTAAHRELPFGARVRVIRIETGASVSVVINDRGPCVVGRVIDLSAAAAQELGIVEQGVALVLIEADPQQLEQAELSQTRISSGC
jgi:peptidoglycan lytic transglycosylase